MFTTCALLFLSLQPQSPVAGQAPLTAGQRYLDFSAALERPGVSVFLGTLDKLKEGKRERLPDGQLGGSGAVAVVSGTQYFKVDATGSLKVALQLVGAPLTRPQIDFELQIARLPDGKERRQVRTGSGAEISEGGLALWVVELVPKAKTLRLLQVIGFDPKADQGADPHQSFQDAMLDIVLVNQRIRDLRLALAAFDGAKTDAAKTQAKTALREVFDKKVELRRPEDDGLLTMHAGPFEQRARERLQDHAEKDGK